MGQPQDEPAPDAAQQPAAVASKPDAKPSLADQSREFSQLWRQAQPLRLLRVLIALIITFGVFLVAGFIPLAIQRSINYLDSLGIGSEGLSTNVLTAVSLTLLAQASLVFLFSVIISYTIAEFFAPRHLKPYRRPRLEIWRSLHRLGNATSITLVCVVASAAVAIGVFGSFMHQDGMPDSPGELAGIQLGTLLFVLTITLVYESVRYTYALLTQLPSFYRGLAALLLPMIAAYTVNFIFPVGSLFIDILFQWTTPMQTAVIERLGLAAHYDQGWGLLGPALLVGSTWVLHFLWLGKWRLLIPKRWRASLPDRHKNEPGILNP